MLRNTYLVIFLRREKQLEVLISHNVVLEVLRFICFVGTLAQLETLCLGDERNFALESYGPGL